MRKEIPMEYQDYIVGADLPGYLSSPHYKVVCNETTVRGTHTMESTSMRHTVAYTNTTHTVTSEEDKYE